MGNARFLVLLRIAAIQVPILTAACGGGGGPTPVVSVTIPPVAPSLYQLAPRATLGSNTALLATGNTTLANMLVGTVLPLRQSIMNVTPNAAFAFGNGNSADGGTLTYKGSQTVNGVTGPVFDLNIPIWQSP